jgi:hypothetical protein
MGKVKVITNAFGLPQAVNRPHMPATKKLDLSGPEGQGKITNILSHKSEIDRPIWV